MGRFPFATVTKRGDMPHTYTVQHTWTYVDIYGTVTSRARAASSRQTRISDAIQHSTAQSGRTLINEANMGTVTFKS